MRASTEPRRGWTEERVARELEAWFAERAIEQWPSYGMFAVMGANGDMPRCCAMADLSAGQSSSACRCSGGALGRSTATRRSGRA